MVGWFDYKFNQMRMIHTEGEMCQKEFDWCLLNLCLNHFVRSVSTHELVEI